MLWILSGSYHSGKNTLRNILAKDYGFSVISKFVSEDTAGETFEYNGVTMATRDPFLVTKQDGNESMENILRSLSETNYSDGVSLNDFERQGWFIYEKTNKQFYLISVKEIKNAIKDDDKNYVLVCSEPHTVQKIRQLVVKDDNDRELTEEEKNQRIKAVLIFGINFKKTEKQALGASVDSNSNKTQQDLIIEGVSKKFSEYFSSIIDFTTVFDYVIYNKEESRDIGTYLRSEWDNMVIKLLRSCYIKSLTDSKTYRPFCYKLNMMRDGTKRIESGVFFVKPFQNSKSMERPNRVYNAVNSRIEEISKKYKIKVDDYFDRDLDYVIQGARVVNYTQPENPHEQMRSQIRYSNLIIVDVADVDDNNMMHKPNCYWELGYARALEKEIVVLADINSGGVQFDERDRVYIQYELNNETLIMKDSFKNSGEKDFTYTFDAEIGRYYMRLKKAMETSYHNRRLLKLAEREQ